MFDYPNKLIISISIDRITIIDTINATKLVRLLVTFKILKAFSIVLIAISKDIIIAVKNDIINTQTIVFDKVGCQINTIEPKAINKSKSETNEYKRLLLVGFIILECSLLIFQLGNCVLLFNNI